MFGIGDVAKRIQMLVLEDVLLMLDSADAEMLSFYI